jgi:hypothetical protein
MAPLLPGASQCPCSHEWLPQLRLLAPAPRCLSEGEAPLQVESSPLAFCLLSSSHGHNQEKGQETPNGVGGSSSEGFDPTPAFEALRREG